MVHLHASKQTCQAMWAETLIPESLHWQTTHGMSCHHQYWPGVHLHCGQKSKHLHNLCGLQGPSEKIRNTYTILCIICGCISFKFLCKPKIHFYWANLAVTNKVLKMSRLFLLTRWTKIKIKKGFLGVFYSVCMCDCSQSIWVINFFIFYYLVTINAL